MQFTTSMDNGYSSDTTHSIHSDESDWYNQISSIQMNVSPGYLWFNRIYETYEPPNYFINRYNVILDTLTKHNTLKLTHSNACIIAHYTWYYSYAGDVDIILTLKKECTHDIDNISKFKCVQFDNHYGVCIKCLYEKQMQYECLTCKSTINCLDCLINRPRYDYLPKPIQHLSHYAFRYWQPVHLLIRRMLPLFPECVVNIISQYMFEMSSSNKDILTTIKYYCKHDQKRKCNTRNYHFGFCTICCEGLNTYKCLDCSSNSLARNCRNGCHWFH